MIKVLIVDDSEVYRVFLHSLLSSEPDIEVVSMARNGKLALPRVNHYKPDVVILDYEMPEMDGLEAMPEIKRISPSTRIIMFSAHTRQGAKLTIRALEQGADDFVTKPAGMPAEGAVDELRKQLLDRIRAFAKQGADQSKAERIPTFEPTRKPRKFRYCAIGVSTGGPPALRRLFRQIPGTIRGSILVVQHMPPVFTAQLAESLSEDSDLTITEATDNTRPMAGSVYIAPGGMQMRLVPDASGGMIEVERGDPGALCRPSVNVLFNSLALAYPENTLAVIMTGMGDDGYLGMRQLSLGGAYLMAQRADDCVIFGMPAKPVLSGLVHEIHDVDGLAQKITTYLQ